MLLDDSLLNLHDTRPSFYDGVPYLTRIDEIPNWNSSFVIKGKHVSKISIFSVSCVFIFIAADTSIKLTWHERDYNVNNMLVIRNGSISLEKNSEILLRGRVQLCL